MKRPSVGLSVCRIAAAMAGGFAAERPADTGGTNRQQPAPRTSCRRAQQQRRRSTALGSKCRQCHVDRRGTRLITDLFERDLGPM